MSHPIKAKARLVNENSECQGLRKDKKGSNNLSMTISYLLSLSLSKGPVAIYIFTKKSRPFILMMGL